jgi:hypothetical protein
MTMEQQNTALLSYSHCIYSFIRLLSIGYYHGDIHSSNVMVNIDEKNYLNEHNKLANKGHSMVIDFGRTTKIIDEDRLKKNPIYVYFTKEFPKMDLLSEDKIKLRENIRILMSYYILRNEDSEYYRENKVKPEGAFFQSNPDKFKRYFGANVSENDIIDTVINIIHSRHEKLQELKKTKMLHRIISLPHQKNDMFDIFGKLDDFKFTDKSYIDTDILLYFDVESISKARKREDIIKGLNSSDLPDEYKNKLMKGRKKVITKEYT